MVLMVAVGLLYTRGNKSVYSKLSLSAYDPAAEAKIGRKQ